MRVMYSLVLLTSGSGFFRRLTILDINCLILSFLFLNLSSYLRAKVTESDYSLTSDTLFRVSLFGLLASGVFIATIPVDTAKIILVAFLIATLIFAIPYVLLGKYSRPKSIEELSAEATGFDLDEIASIHAGIHGNQPASVFDPRDLLDETKEEKESPKEESIE